MKYYIKKENGFIFAEKLQSAQVVSKARPTLTTDDVGVVIFDKILNKPVWWSGTEWLDSSGSPAPRPYDAQVEYLQGTGTQWINTNFVPVQDDLNVVIDATPANGDMFVYGINGTNPRLNLNWYNGVNLYFRYRDYNTRFTITSARHIIENGVVKKLDEEVLASPIYSDSVTFVGNANKLALFGTANAPEPTGVNYPWTGKIHEFWIYYGEELQMHLIPVRKDGVGYMYDLVSKQLFGNSGTGDFTYGNDV
jgi:hypothetical protein